MSGVIDFNCSSANFLAFDMAIPGLMATPDIASNMLAIENICGLVFTGDMSTTRRLDTRSDCKDKFMFLDSLRKLLHSN